MKEPQMKAQEREEEWMAEVTARVMWSRDIERVLPSITKLYENGTLG